MTNIVYEKIKYVYISLYVNCDDETIRCFVTYQITYICMAYCTYSQTQQNILCVKYSKRMVFNSNDTNDEDHAV